MNTVETAADLEQLVADLLEEAYALRMKYEEFSRYTEAKVAEFVSARRELQTERDYAFHHLALVQQDLHILRQRQDQLHEQLHKAVKQRDRARARVAALEASRAVRFAVRIRKLLRR
jgi:chromosome segregation ATPase